MSISRFVADAPKRAELRSFKQFNAYYGCDVCTQRTSWVRLRNGYRKRVYPVDNDVHRAPLRTHDETLEIANRLEELDQNDRKGVTGKSVLFDIQGFDVIKSMMPEYMHWACIGVVEKLVRLTFQLGEKPKTHRDYQRTSAERLNGLLPTVRLPTDLSRRSREVDVAKYKAEEYRNLILLMFPLVLECLEARTEHARIWALLAFVLRSNCIPDREYAFVSKRDLEILTKRLLTNWQSSFGTPTMVYNVHQICHLDVIRSQGNLPDNSAFPYERMFSVLRRDLVASTPNPGKQCIQRMYETYEASHTNCRKQLRVRFHTTSKADDTLFYLFDNTTGRYTFMKAKRYLTDDGETLLASKILTAPTSVGIATLKWETVGVFTKVSEVEYTVAVRTCDIAGKAVECRGNIISLPRNVIEES
jgi:hypothetical protein